MNSATFQQGNCRDKCIFGPGPKHILAIDGGGVRGLIALAYLERIERWLRQTFGDGMRLSDAFDLIGGTSTGALIATGVSLGMEAGELISTYLSLSRRVFRGGRWHGGAFVPKFRTKPLLRAIRARVGDETLGSDKLRTGLAIVAKRLDSGSVWVFHNNPKGKYFGAEGQSSSFVSNKDLPLAQLLRASAAAPTFFAPEDITIAPGVQGRFVDGGVSPYNNPALLLLMLATVKGYGFNWPTGVERLSIISLGTGIEPIAPEQTRSMLSAALAVQSLKSVLQDASWQTQTILQWLGDTLDPWEIDSEIGDLSADQLGPEPLFRYIRCNVMLEQRWLADNLDIALSERELKALALLDRADRGQALLDIGRAAASRQIKPQYLQSLLKLSPSPSKGGAPPADDAAGSDLD